MSPEIVGPKVFSWSEPDRRSSFQHIEKPLRDTRIPIQIKYLYIVNFDILRLVKLTDQSGDCMQVDKAAPIPVPVQIRIPRLYSLDELETPAS